MSLSTTLLTYKSVGQPSVMSVIHHNCQQPLTIIEKGFQSLHPSAGQGIHIYSQQGL